MSKRKVFILVVLVCLAVTAWEWLRDRYADDEKALRSAVRAHAVETLPQLDREIRQRYGLAPHPADADLDLSRPLVILVHGLDDPGRVWRNLAPVLRTAGYGVWLLRYPDDQPIRASADLFHAELRQLKAWGVERLSIVAHSMGGLVSRDLLTHPGLPRHPAIPQVERLIMVGTPNHGSELARFRLFAEFRDQFAEWLSGNGSRFGWLMDGAGEAGIDLTPGSAFLQDLNQRPAPADTRMAVIAGVLAEPDRQLLLDKVSTLVRAHGLDERINDGARVLGRFHDELLSGLGDGLVSVDSARLAAADLHRVQGNHLSIIRNVSDSSERMPPAIPIILQALEGASAAGGETTTVVSQ